MKVALYVKPGVIGLSFGTSRNRDHFWQAMGSNGNSGPESPAEKFGEKIIRLHPENFKAKMWWELDVANISPNVETVKTEIKVQAGDLRAPEPLPPVAIIPNEPAPAEMVKPAAPSVELPPPPPAVAIPEVASMTAAAPVSADDPNDPKPAVHHRTKEFIAWRKRQDERERLATASVKA